MSEKRRLDTNTNTNTASFIAEVKIEMRTEGFDSILLYVLDYQS